MILNEGRPLVVTSERYRIGQGPWARLLATAAVQDEGSSVAARGRALAREGSVHTVEVAEGVLSAGVGERCTATIVASLVPPRIWAAMTRFARGNPPLQAAVEGRGQSVHLEHLMTIDWEEPLVPPAHALRRSCTCRDEGETGVCEHVAALAYVVADAIDSEPSLLLRWRGCTERAIEAPEPEPERQAAVVALGGDAWQAGTLPTLAPPRPLPIGAVMKRLGPSGLRVGGDDLAEALQRAYAVFAERPTPLPT